MVVRVIQGITAVVAAVVLVALMVDQHLAPKRPILPLLLIAVCAYVAATRD
jgi:hypothetical protein